MKEIEKLKPSKAHFGLLLIRGRCVMDKVEIDKIPTEKAMEILRRGGLDVNREETELIMEFLYNLTYLAIKQYIISP